MQSLQKIRDNNLIILENYTSKNKNIYTSTIRPRLGCIYHIRFGVPNIYLDILDEIQ